MQIKYTIPKGTKDILPGESEIWTSIESTIRDICKNFGYDEIRTPEFEHTDLFMRGVGDTTDIVQKEMYTFSRNDKESFTLRPEGTSSVMRSFIENGMSSSPQPVKLFYIIRCFRCENPQKGRQRQFHQFGIELLGAKSAMADAEVILIADTLIKKLGIENISLRINSVGCPTCRAKYYETLREYIKESELNLCNDCSNRLEKNPMRVFDCKNDNCKTRLVTAPRMIDELCEDCNTHFSEVKNYLEASSVEFEVDPNIVRGLDYYTNTAFEFISNDLGAQATMCGGGRYDGLCETFGGDKTAGVGFGMGMERLMMILEAQGKLPDTKKKTDLYIASLGNDANKLSIRIASILRNSSYNIQTDLLGRSLKAQLKYADKINARFVLIMGENEIENKILILRNMQTKEQHEISINDAPNEIMKYIG